MTDLQLAVVLVASAPTLLGVGVGLRSHRLVGALSPALATAALTALALTVALCTGVELVLLAYVGTVELVPTIHPADWSPGVLRRQFPVPDVVALAAGLAVVVLLARAGVRLATVVLTSRRTSRRARRLPSTGGLAVLEDAAVLAYAVPGRHSRIVVTTGLLRRLTGPQRRAVLAHERAHLRRHHHWYVHLTRLAVAAHPLLRPVAPAVDRAVERWADADAARQVGDPAIVAAALGVVALGARGAPEGGLAADGGDVVERVRDLLEPPRRRASTGIMLTLAVLACWVGTALVVLYVQGLVELAELSS